MDEHMNEQTMFGIDDVEDRLVFNDGHQNMDACWIVGCFALIVSSETARFHQIDLLSNAKYVRKLDFNDSNFKCS